MCEDSNFDSAEETLELPYQNMLNVAKNIPDFVGLQPLNDIKNIDPGLKKYVFLFSMQTFQNSIVFFNLNISLL
jgi:hypothetical protein